MLVSHCKVCSKASHCNEARGVMGHEASGLYFPVERLSIGQVQIKVRRCQGASYSIDGGQEPMSC